MKKMIIGFLAALFSVPCLAGVFIPVVCLGDLSVSSTAATATASVGAAEVWLTPTVDVWITVPGPGTPVAAVAGAAGTQKLPAGGIYVIGIPNNNGVLVGAVSFSYVSATAGTMNTCFGFGE